MKIQVGKKARILGTKKVSPEGRVDGLRDVAGKNVLIVVPSVTPRVAHDLEDYFDDAQNMLRQQAQVALRGVKTLRHQLERGLTPATQAVVDAAPRRYRPLVRKADQWVRATARNLEKQVGRLAKN